MKRTITTLALASIAALSFGQVMSNNVLAFDNATVQPAGVRTGSGNDNFFNIQGFDNGNFASYGVADFDLTGAFNDPFGPITELTLKLTQQNAGFTTDGTVRFWLTGDTITSIDNDGSSPLFYDTTNLPSGVQVGQLAPLFDLGTGDFVQTGNGDEDAYTFVLGGAESALVTSTALANGTLRMVVTPETNGVSATWAGFGNTNSAGPTIMMNAVPEPASMIALGAGLAALAARRRRKA